LINLTFNSRPIIIADYFEVFTIAKRFDPFARVNPTRVTLFEIGEKPFMRPVTPVFEVVNKSPIWYVYP
jgi:hypothetical protein